jgi:enoyl-CoA hydratase
MTHCAKLPRRPLPGGTGPPDTLCALGAMESQPADLVVIERAGAVTTLRLNRPKALNALDPDTLRALRGAIDTVEADDMVRAVVLTGTGDKAFCAGADITAMAAMGPTDGHPYACLGHEVMARVDDCRVPVVAAVNGVALGGGLELALACDFVVAGERARVGLPEITLGIIPGFGGTQRLVRRIGLARARELIYLGSMVGAADAHALGIVDRVVPGERVAAEAAALAGELASRPPLALRQAKRATRAAEETTLEAGLRLEIEAFAATFASDDRVEGLRAFLEKRAPQWKGR